VKDLDDQQSERMESRAEPMPVKKRKLFEESEM
jgi:hypothetical protein